MRKILMAGAAACILTASPAFAAPTIMDGSFETPNASGSPGRYVYTPSVAGVTFNAGSGVQRNGSDWGFANAPDGLQTAFIQSTSSYTGQITFALTNLIVGQAYNFNFSAAARPNYASNAFTVAVNGATLGSYNTTDATWRSFSTGSFIAAATSASLSFTGSATTTGDNDVGLDNVTIAAVPEPAAWAMMILGMGAIGFAMRRQKAAVRMSHAA